MPFIGPKANLDGEKYDVIIIGAGMSGLAAAIRLALFEKKVLLLEKHSLLGGLNSYYQRGRRRLDVGLHALTNFAEKGDRRSPLGKLLKQLRIPYDRFELTPQLGSKVIFPEAELSFDNHIETLEAEVARRFPGEVENFARLFSFIKNYNELDLTATYQSARAELKKFIESELLRDMIMAPLLIYGSAWEEDMDLGQFVIMFKSIFLQGFGRPAGGVRTIIDALKEKYLECGGKLAMRREVRSIRPEAENRYTLELADGSQLEAAQVLSTVGLVETGRLLADPQGRWPAEWLAKSQVGAMSFCECIQFFPMEEKIPASKSTIIFYNNRNRYHYKKPAELCDFESAVLCCPNHYERKSDELGGPQELVLRATFMANFDRWSALSRESYLEEKAKVAERAQALFEQFYPQVNGLAPSFTDVFSPTTILRYTGHFGGAVYGSPTKIRDGRTPLPGLYLAGTDQGFLGITGAMLSGITVANQYLLL